MRDRKGWRAEYDKQIHRWRNTETQMKRKTSIPWHPVSVFHSA
jgi:lysozyme family protein